MSTDTSVNVGVASHQVASTSALPAQQSRKAVMLKGPSLTSKTYFVPLPDTLDQLVEKAVQLFPIPPGKVPHISLGADERAIILPDSYDLIRDRELLHFRWSAETPRRNLANRVRWDQSVAAQSTTPFSLNPTVSPQSAPSESTETTGALASEAIKAQLHSSATIKRDLASTTRANTISNRDPNSQVGEGASARKAHAQRVLAEQQRKREEENGADALGFDVDQDLLMETELEASERAASKLASTSTSSDVLARTSDGNKITQESSSPTAAPQPCDTTPSWIDDAVQEVVLAPTTVAGAIQSPPRKKPVDNGGLDTPPSSGSRSSSPFHSSDRGLNAARSLDNRMLTNPDDEPSSSPISSPTRDVSSRFRTISSAELGPPPVLAAAQDELQGDDMDISKATAPKEADNGKAPPIIEVQDASLKISTDTITSSTTAKEVTTRQDDIASTAATKPSNDRELNRIYSFLSNLVSQLLSHKANWVFQRPMSVEFEQFSARSSRPVDLFTIRDSLASRTYGSQLLEGRMAANAVVTDFEDDLSLLYNNARRFFGIRSTQAECVEHLEKFSRSFLNEWKRTQGNMGQGKPASQTSSDAVARLSAFRSPGSRSEKRPLSPFAMLMTLNQSVSNGNAPNSSNKKAVNGQLQGTGSAGMMRRPEFGFMRNGSYEGAMSTVKRLTQPARATSEAFEKALRAASATPQTERVKPRQEVVAPFATHSVIETDFMARPAPQPQTQPEPQTPVTSGMKRKLAQATFDSSSKAETTAAVATRSPSVSPPPSPSPTKRNQAAGGAPKLNKSAGRRNNKRKAKQAAAAAAAAQELTKTKTKTRGGDADEEQHVLTLLDAQPPASKRARTAKGQPNNANVNPAETTPQTKGKGKSKQPRSSTPAAAPAATDTMLTVDIPSTPSLRSLRPRRISSSNPNEGVPPPKTPPRHSNRSGGKHTQARQEAAEVAMAEQTMDVDGFEVTGSRRRSSRPRKPVHLD